MENPDRDPPRFSSRLKRDLGLVESYAALVGILVGAGIFRVTSDAYAATGPSVILGYLVLAPAVFATSIPYAVYASTSLGSSPGGEYAHLAATFHRSWIAFLGAWLKCVAYLGACAYLALALADYALEMLEVLLGRGVELGGHAPVLATGALVFFFAVHAAGVRWFGRVQVWMCAVLGISIAILVVPGLFEVRAASYRPFFTGGARGFAGSLPMLFFAYAGFESLAQAAGEVRASRETLPRVYLRGIAVTTVLFLLISIVAFGVLPGPALATSEAPMAAVAAVYLPLGATALVALGGTLAAATSLNPSLHVPARLWILLAEDGHLPRWIGRVDPRTGTPTAGLAVALAVACALLWSGQMRLALNVAVFALVLLYFAHGVGLLLLPRTNPALFAEVRARVPRGLQVLASVASLASMGALIAIQVVQDARRILASDARERWRGLDLTCVELLALWSLVGLALYAAVHRGRPAGRGRPGYEGA